MRKEKTKLMPHTDEKIKAIAKKWYSKLDFPKEYDEKFEELLQNTSDFEELSIFDFDLKANEKEYQKNAVYALYFCEETERIFAKKNIPCNILLDTLWDIKFRTIVYTDRVGKMGLDKLCDWLFLHLKGENIHLGRLQYQIKNFGYDVPTHGLFTGDPILAVHIPSGPKLTKESALASFKLAENFFKKYFPEHNYKCFTCNSWLLDNKNLPEFLPAGSNILDFQSVFEIVELGSSDDAFIFAFPHGVNRENVKDFTPKTSLQSKIKDFVLKDGVLYMGFGIHKKSQN